MVSFFFPTYVCASYFSKYLALSLLSFKILANSPSKLPSTTFALNQSFVHPFLILSHTIWIQFIHLRQLDSARQTLYKKREGWLFVVCGHDTGKSIRSVLDSAWNNADIFSDLVSTSSRLFPLFFRHSLAHFYWWYQMPFKSQRSRHTLFLTFWSSIFEQLHTKQKHYPCYNIQKLLCFSAILSFSWWAYTYPTQKNFFIRQEYRYAKSQKHYII